MTAFRVSLGLNRQAEAITHAGTHDLTAHWYGPCLNAVGKARSLQYRRRQIQSTVGTHRNTRPASGIHLSATHRRDNSLAGILSCPNGR